MTDELHSPANAGLATSRSAPSGAPCVVVPREPTKEMVDAALGDKLRWSAKATTGYKTRIRTIYRAMLAAAPAAQPNAELAQRLRGLHAQKKAAHSGVHGQQCGLEMWTITASGNDLEALHEAADALSHERGDSHK